MRKPAPFVRKPESFRRKPEPFVRKPESFVRKPEPIRHAPESSGHAAGSRRPAAAGSDRENRRWDRAGSGLPIPSGSVYRPRRIYRRAAPGANGHPQMNWFWNARKSKMLHAGSGSSSHAQGSPAMNAVWKAR